MHRSLTGPVWALLMAVPLGLGVVPGAPTSGSQETQAVVRLQQEVSALRYRLDFEAQQTRRSIEQLQSRLQAVDQLQRRGGVSPEPVPLRIPAPIETDSQISAGRFVVEDAQGRARGVATVSEAFGPMLALLDVRGDVRLMVASPEDGPRVDLFDERLQLRLSARLQRGEPVVELLDVDGHSLAALVVRGGEATLDLSPRER